MKQLTNEQIVKFQLYQSKMCRDFSRFHEAIEHVLDRPVFTHEFARPENLRSELEQKKGKPTFDDIVEQLPQQAQTIIAIH